MTTKKANKAIKRMGFNLHFCQSASLHSVAKVQLNTTVYRGVRGMCAMDHLDQYYERIGGAIGVLAREQYIEAALMLTFAGIDQMAWLSVSAQESSGADFKVWAEKYIQPAQILGCTVDDLWAARNALLHTATAESRDTAKGKAKKVYYTTGSAVCTENKSPDAIFINAHHLIGQFIASWLTYRLDIQANPALLQQATEKAKQILSYKKGL